MKNELLANNTKINFHEKNHGEKWRPLELVLSNTYGPISPLSSRDKIYIISLLMIIVGKFRFIFFLEKSQVFEAYI